MNVKDPEIIQLIPAPVGWEAYAIYFDDDGKPRTEQLPIVGLALIKKTYGYQNTENVVRLVVKSEPDGLDTHFTPLDRDFMTACPDSEYFTVGPGEEFDEKKAQAVELLAHAVKRKAEVRS